MQGIAWRWQSIDGAMFKAPLAQESVGKKPTDRGKKAASAIFWWTPWRPVIDHRDRSQRAYVTQLDVVLAARMVKRKLPKHRRSVHLCADAGYRGQPALDIIGNHGYIPRMVGRKSEAQAKQRHPGKKAQRWVVEVCHSWFNRFRKLLVRYEKLHRSCMALNHLAAGIIAFRKVPLQINIIYG